MNLAFWNNRRVFVTGHTGFKGSWICLWLQHMGANVTGYALKPPTNPSLFEIANVAYGMTSIIGDIRNKEELIYAMQKAQPEIVIHMAAQPLVRFSYKNPVETYLTNVMGSVHLFEAVRHTGSVRAVVNVTTDKCYENKEWHWAYRENEPLGGYDPYSSSKACSELVTAAYRNSYFSSEEYSIHGVAIASARAGNVIGGGDWATDRLIPDVMNSLKSGCSVLVRNPYAIRPWQHVLEPLSGYLILAEKLLENGSDFANGWNFGPNEEDAKTVQWVVERLTEYWGKSAHWKIDERVHPHEANYLKLDISKARALLNWQPKWNLNYALESIVQWEKSYQSQLDMRAMTLNQIIKYANSASTQ
jgi:CDP-glucose 4,6-dehydratase